MIRQDLLATPRPPCQKGGLFAAVSSRNGLGLCAVASATLWSPTTPSASSGSKPRWVATRQQRRAWQLDIAKIHHAVRRTLRFAVRRLSYRPVDHRRSVLVRR